MNNLFSQRRDQLWKNYLKYARLAFNNHFVIFLLFAASMGIYLYRQALTDVTTNFWSVALLASLSVSTLLFGHLVTYAKPADQVFLFADETDARKMFNQGFKYSVISSWLMMLLMFAVITPFALKMISSIIWLVIILVFLLIKFFLLWQIKNSIQQKNQGINWQRAIEVESNRQQRINRFYSMFTDVRGLATKIKKRSYLDWFKKTVLESNSGFYQFFFANKFIRGQFFGLILRLMLVGFFLTFLLANNSWLIAASIILIFSYLIGFQLSPLYYDVDQIELTKIYPIDQSEKRKAITMMITNLLVIFALIAILIAGLGGAWNWQLIVATVVVEIVLSRIYFPWRLRK